MDMRLEYRDDKWTITRDGVDIAEKAIGLMVTADGSHRQPIVTLEFRPDTLTIEADEAEFETTRFPTPPDELLAERPTA